MCVPVCVDSMYEVVGVVTLANRFCGVSHNAYYVGMNTLGNPTNTKHLRMLTFFVAV